MEIEKKLQSLGLEMPDTPKPVGNYVPAVKSGSLVFTSGQTARINGVRRYVGKIGAGISDEEGYLSSRDAALNCLACVKQAVGDLDSIVRIVKVTGFVNCVDGYMQQPAIINGASDLLEKLFGENGKPARSAIGVSSLPYNVSVELEMVVEVK